MALINSSLTPPPLPPDLNPDNGGKKRQGLIWLLVALAIMIITIGGYFIYSKNRTEKAEKEAAELAAEKLRADSLANQARLDSLKMDSIAREEFISSFVKPGDILRVSTASYYDQSIPDIIFRRDAEERLREAGYDVISVTHDTRECDGGEVAPFTVTTFEKKWGEGDSLWSRVTLDDGCCGNYTVEFCNAEQYDRFLEECRKLGYSQKRKEEGSVLLMIGKTIKGEDLSWYIHENYHAVIELLKDKVIIYFGCV